MTNRTLAPDRMTDPGQMDEPHRLWPNDVERLNLKHHPRLTEAEAVALLSESPGSSYWIPRTNEFVIVSPWRHRDELVTPHTVGAFGNEDALLRTAMTNALARGLAGFVMVDIRETRNPDFYARHDLRRLEDIVTFEHRRPASLAAIAIPDGLEFVKVDGSDPGLLRDVQDLDHAAFPWFWWNSAQEFDAYLRIPGVEIWAGVRNREVVSYAGSTIYRRWAHLDRIATHPSLQGRGLGRATLAHAVRMTVRKGTREVVLSTQGDNPRSRSLYEQTGFVRTPVDDYSIFVAPFHESLVYAGIAKHDPATPVSGDRS